MADADDFVECWDLFPTHSGPLVRPPPIPEESRAIPSQHCVRCGVGAQTLCDACLEGAKLLPGTLEDALQDFDPEEFTETCHICKEPSPRPETICIACMLKARQAALSARANLEGAARENLATRTFRLGGSGPNIAQGTSVWFDGHILSIQGRPLQHFPAIRGAIRCGWLVPVESNPPQEGIRELRSRIYQNRVTCSNCREQIPVGQAIPVEGQEVGWQCADSRQCERNCWAGPRCTRCHCTGG